MSFCKVRGQSEYFFISSNKAFHNCRTNYCTFFTTKRDARQVTPKHDCASAAPHPRSHCRKVFSFLFILFYILFFVLFFYFYFYVLCLFIFYIYIDHTPGNISMKCISLQQSNRTLVLTCHHWTSLPLVFSTKWLLLVTPMLTTKFYRMTPVCNPPLSFNCVISLLICPLQWFCHSS